MEFNGCLLANNSRHALNIAGRQRETTLVGPIRRELSILSDSFVLLPGETKLIQIQGGIVLVGAQSKHL